VNGVTYTFASWSDGGPATHTISTPDVDTTYTATYTSSGSPIVYLSDLTPTSAVNGWGPIEKDKSNGEQALGDGKTITLNGVTYAKGVGMHSNADVTYNIAGLGLKTFASDIGLDDETAFYGNVIFQVYLDGATTPAYDSGLMNNNSTTKSINLDITGKSTLRLVVADGGDDIWNDHADWANARLLGTASNNASPVATILTPTAGAKYTAGASISYSGSGTDTEDGTLAVSKFTWKIDRVKGTQVTNVLPATTGATSGTYLVPSTGDTDPSVFYRITLTVTDSAGATNTVTRDVLPTTVTLTLQSSPAGAPLTADGVTSAVITSVVGMQRSIAAPATATIGGTAYAFANWSDGGAATHTVTTPSTNTTYTATYTAQTSAVPVYLSDLTATSITNGFGPMEKDKSNGESAAGDGKTITLNTVTYAKGLGVHANSDLSYALAGKYATFVSDMGLDDEVGSNGSAVFQVWLDGTKVYDSGTVTGSTATKSVAINVTGKTTLRLVVTDGGNNFNYDHADWAGARLLPVTTSLPAGWTSSNIGTVGQSGSAGFIAGGSYVVGGSGTDIGGTSDSFRYVYQQITGNVQLTARVTSLGFTDPGAKAGVMLRTSLAANSVSAGMFVTAGSGYSSTRRTTAGGSTTATTGGASAFPYWVRIVRSGTTVTTYRSTDGTTWTQVSTATVSLGTTIYVGLAVTSKNNSSLTTAVFDNVSVVSLP
jgi:regulation of enolase protein 1 (concanavalin A-like superfamily)